MATAGLDMRPTATDLDATAFCNHLRAALAGGTPSDCAVAYVAKLMSCFHPAGACGATFQYPASTSCWANGAAFEASFSLGTVVYRYAMSGQRCGTITEDTGGPYSAFFCASTAGYDCDARNPGDMAAATAHYLGGTFTCPDGTQLDVGNIFGCAELKQFVAPACDRSVDGGSCTFP
jgi:hypothetical protein